jgi:hypothetical protein
MPDAPLPTLLSQVLVVFTIEFERLMPHRTARRGSTGGSNRIRTTSGRSHHARNGWFAPHAKASLGLMAG